MSVDYWKLSAVELAEGIRRRDYSATDVVTSVLDRIRARNPELNAITVDCSADALIEAERADAAIRRAGAYLGAGLVNLICWLNSSHRRTPVHMGSNWSMITTFVISGFIFAPVFVCV